MRQNEHKLTLWYKNYAWCDVLKTRIQITAAKRRHSIPEVWCQRVK